jgi:uncharacterized OB-fold protein
MTFEAHGCPNGHVTYPAHHRCPECGESQQITIDLSERTATIVTWTISTATPPGVRAPNPLAIVEFELEQDTVRAIGGLTTGDIKTGDKVRPTYVDELRDPTAGIRWPESQAWDGYRFEPV